MRCQEDYAIPRWWYSHPQVRTGSNLILLSETYTRSLLPISKICPGCVTLRGEVNGDGAGPGTTASIERKAASKPSGLPSGVLEECEQKRRDSAKTRGRTLYLGLGGYNQGLSRSQQLGWALGKSQESEDFVESYYSSYTLPYRFNSTWQ